MVTMTSLSLGPCVHTVWASEQVVAMAATVEWLPVRWPFILPECQSSANGCQADHLHAAKPGI